MVGMMGRVPVGSRFFMGSGGGVEFSGKMSCHDDNVFGFFEEGSLDSVSSDSTDGFEEDELSEHSIDRANRSKAFWETQRELLQNTLFRTNSLEARIREATKGALREAELEKVVCVCKRPVVGDCRNCLLTRISDRLGNAGFCSAICKSKWKSSPDIPAGEHTYLDVVQKSSKQTDVRVVIELNFRGEFEMARASEEYNRLIARLPEVYVGKAERLQSLIKILCSAAKKCMKENNMHMGPWRKHKYMHAKWFGTCERTVCQPLLTKSTERTIKSKASMLTFDMLDALPGLQQLKHCDTTRFIVNVVQARE